MSRQTSLQIISPASGDSVSGSPFFMVSKLSEPSLVLAYQYIAETHRYGIADTDGIVDINNRVNARQAAGLNISFSVLQNRVCGAKLSKCVDQRWASVHPVLLHVDRRLPSGYKACISVLLKKPGASGD